MTDEERLALIERTKNFGRVKNPDGSISVQLRLSFEGSVNIVCREINEIAGFGF